MANSDEKLCRQVSEFGSLCEGKDLRENICTKKVMGCSRYVNVGPMHVRLHGERLEDVDHYLRSHVAADGECEMGLVHRINEGYKAWEALKCVLSSRGLG